MLWEEQADPGRLSASFVHSLSDENRMEDHLRTKGLDRVWCQERYFIRTARFRPRPSPRLADSRPGQTGKRRIAIRTVVAANPAAKTRPSGKRVPDGSPGERRDDRESVE